MESRSMFFRSFYLKVVLTFIASLLFVALLGNFILFRYSLKLQFNQFKDKLAITAQTAALFVDSSALDSIPLNPEGIKAPAFENIAVQLLRIKQANPLIQYIYIMKMTDKPGIWQFVVDPDALTEKKIKRKVTSYPGDKYDASRFPGMLNALKGPTTDSELVIDEWGKALSGYAPISDRSGRPVAVLGVDIDAADVYFAEKGLFYRGLFVLLMGVIFSLGLGFIFSARIIDPIKKLIEGTKHLSAGDLKYRVKVNSYDEIGQLAGSFNEMAANLSETREKLHDYFYRVVQAMVRSLEAKDPYTRGHSDRVGDYAYAIAVEMGIAPEKAEELRKAAQLHDIGKLGIHEDILNKTSELSKSEWDIVRKHPEVGEEILRPVFLDAAMLSVVRSHHERYDGTGYPDGLKAGQCGIFAQIASVADAYDAMITARSYKAGMQKDDVIKKLKEGSGAQFNPIVVQAFIKILERQAQEGR